MKQKAELIRQTNEVSRQTNKDSILFVLRKKRYFLIKKLSHLVALMIRQAGFCQNLTSCFMQSKLNRNIDTETISDEDVLYIVLANQFPYMKNEKFVKQILKNKIYQIFSTLPTYVLQFVKHSVRA